LLADAINDAILGIMFKPHRFGRRHRRYRDRCGQQSTPQQSRLSPSRCRGLGPARTQRSAFARGAWFPIPHRNDAVRCFYFVFLFSFLLHASGWQHRELCRARWRRCRLPFPARVIPDIDAARRSLAQRLRPAASGSTRSRASLLLEAYESRCVETVAAAEAEPGRGSPPSAIFAQVAPYVLKIMSREHCSHRRRAASRSQSHHPRCRASRPPTSRRGRKRCPRVADAGVIVQAMMCGRKSRELILCLADIATFGPVGCSPRRTGGRDHQRQGSGSSAARSAIGP